MFEDKRCELCGGKVRVEGNTTKYYVPIEEDWESEIAKSMPCDGCKEKQHQDCHVTESDRELSNILCDVKLSPYQQYIAIKSLLAKQAKRIEREAYNEGQNDARAELFVIDKIASDKALAKQAEEIVNWITEDGYNKYDKGVGYYGISEEGIRNLKQKYNVKG